MMNQLMMLLHDYYRDRASYPDRIQDLIQDSIRDLKDVVSSEGDLDEDYIEDLITAPMEDVDYYAFEQGFHACLEIMSGKAFEHQIPDCRINDFGLEDAAFGLSREDALALALKRINSGHSFEYISHDLGDFFGIKITPEELEQELADGLLPAAERQANAWLHIFGDDTQNLTHINLPYLEEKYGFDRETLRAAIDTEKERRAQNETKSI